MSPTLRLGRRTGSMQCCISTVQIDLGNLNHAPNSKTIRKWQVFLNIIYSILNLYHLTFNNGYVCHLACKFNSQFSRSRTSWLRNATVSLWLQKGPEPFHESASSRPFWRTSMRNAVIHAFFFLWILDEPHTLGFLFVPVFPFGWQCDYWRLVYGPNYWC